MITSSHVWGCMDEMLKPPLDAATRESLERIAHPLDKSVLALFSIEGESTREDETLALVKAFERITHKQARARCLAFVYAQAASRAND